MGKVANHSNLPQNLTNMKKYIIKNGLIGGLIVGSVLLGSTLMGMDNMENQWTFYVGITGMLAAFAFIFVGVNQYKQRENGGYISFGQALQIGLGIAALSSTIYVAIWIIELNTIYPDFMEKYAEMMIKKAQKDGLDGSELQAKMSDMDQYKEWYKNPIMVILLTYMEILPLGIVVALISALAQKKTMKT